MPALFPGLPLVYRPLLQRLQELARARGQRVWLCGGTLRDLLLGRRPPDVDLCASGEALALGRSWAAETKGRFVLLDPEHATCRLVWPGGIQADLAGLRAGDIEGDLRRRDFTVNALAWELGAALAGRGGVLDPTGGKDDLAAGLLRPAGPEVLRADPLRVLRAFRFLATHGFSLAPGTDERLSAAAPGLFRVARERIAHEWRLMMAGARAGRAVRGLEEVQALTRLVPALAFGRGVEQNPYHHLDVLGHSLACVESLDAIAARPREHLGDLGREVSQYLAQPEARARLATAALLHDLGKPATRRQRKPGWATFYHHDREGARLARDACRKLGLSKADREVVGLLVREHMRPFHLMGAWRRGQFSPRGVRRLLAAVGDHLAGLMALALADTMAGRGPLRPPDAEELLVAVYRRVAELRDRELARALAAPPLIDGHRLMAALGLEPGPEVGRLLKAVREAQLEGEIQDPTQALELARRLWREAHTVD